MMGYKLRCPVCRDTFKWDVSKGFPEYCQIPACEAFIGADEKNAVSAPYIALKGGETARVIDKVYRDAEAAAEARIDQAVAMTPGSTREDFAQLKVTDYRPNMVEGEAAVRPPQVSQEFKNHVDMLRSAPPAPAMAHHGVTPNGMIQLNGQAQQYSAMTQAGPEPNAGAKAMKRVRATHAERVDPRMNHAISDIPALETQAPGYLPRA